MKIDLTEKEATIIYQWLLREIHYAQVALKPDSFKRTKFTKENLRICKNILKKLEMDNDN